MTEKEKRALTSDVFLALVIDSTAHIVTLDALVDALEEAKSVGHRIDCCIRCITVASRTPRTPMVN